MKGLVRDLLGGLLSASGMTQPRRFGRRQLSIATFHRVLPAELRDRYPYPGMVVTPEELDWFLEFFTDNFLCTTLAGAYRLFRGAAFPERPLLAITFDDAQRDNFLHARPVLQARDLRASFYVPVDAVEQGAPLWHDRLGFAVLAARRQSLTEPLDRLFEHDTEDLHGLIWKSKEWTPEARRRRVEEAELLVGRTVPDWAAMMSWSEVRQLAEEGHEIGSHSVSHALLPQLDVQQITREVVDSKARIEAEIGGPISSFCYPNGDVDDRAAEAVRRAGYLCAVTTRWGLNDADADPYRLARCDMNARYATARDGRMSRPRVAWRMSGLHPGL